MRKLIVCNLISLDGFYSGKDGNIMAMPFDKGFSEYNAQRLTTADTLLLGKRTYEMFKSYWPSVFSDETQPSVEREISRLNTAIEKVVVSNSLKPADIGGWGPTRIVCRPDAREEVASLKRGNGQDILVFGSHILWNDLLDAGLVDELHFMIGPGIVGEGVRAFETRQSRRLHLVGTSSFEGSSLLLLRYSINH